MCDFLNLHGISLLLYTNQQNMFVPLNHKAHRKEQVKSFQSDIYVSNASNQCRCFFWVTAAANVIGALESILTHLFRLFMNKKGKQEEMSKQKYKSNWGGLKMQPALNKGPVPRYFGAGTPYFPDAARRFLSFTSSDVSYSELFNPATRRYLFM